MLPTGKAGKMFITETTRLLNAWIDGNAIKDITFKATVVIPSLLLQKPTKNSKAKD